MGWTKPDEADASFISQSAVPAVHDHFWGLAGLAWETSLVSLGVAVPHAQAKDVQLYSGRDIGAPSPAPSQNAAAPLTSNDRVTFVPSGAAAGHSGLSTSPVLGIVLGCAAALILATLLGRSKPLNYRLLDLPPIPHYSPDVQYQGQLPSALRHWYIFS